MSLSLAGNGTITGVTGLPSFSVGKVLQIVASNFTGVFSSTVLNTWLDTPLSLSITPSLPSNKILLMTDIKIGGSGDQIFAFRFSGGNSGAYESVSGNVVDSAHTMHRYNGFYNSFDPYGALSASCNYIDSPNSETEITYTLQVRCNSGTIYVNRGEDNYRSASSFIAMEIAS